MNVLIFYEGSVYYIRSSRISIASSSASMASSTSSVLWSLSSISSVSCASMCFASPFSTPPNALVMQAGGYTFIDYIKVGLPLQIIMGLVMIGALPLLFPF